MNTLQEKQEHIQGLMNVINLLSGVSVTRQMKEQVENLAGALAIDLDNLLNESKLKEADIKIASFTKVVAILKHEGGQEKSTYKPAYAKHYEA